MPGFANLTQFDRSTADTAKNMYFQQAATDLHQASNGQYYITFDALRARVGADEETRSVVNVGLINAAYDIMNYDESDPSNPDNGWRLEGNALVPIQDKQQFFNVYTTLLSPLKNSVEGSAITFKFRNDLQFSNSNSKPISNITADLGDGVLHSIYTNGAWSTSAITINYTQTATYFQKYTITYSSGEIINTYSLVDVITPEFAMRTMTTTGNIANFSITSDYAFTGYEEGDVPVKGILDYRVFYRNGHNGKLMKPIIILDGIDFGDQRKIQQSDYANPTDTIKNLRSIYNMMEYTSNNIVENYVEDLRAKGYDVIIVNFPSDRIKNPRFAQFPLYEYNMLPLQYRFIDGGADYIERNALTFVTMLKRIDQELRNNGSNQKTIVFGPSMGGQVSRYALAWMEKNNIPHNVSLWVSMDSPHHGANIPIGLQSALYLVKEAGEAAGADFYNFSLKSPAAQQMLINQHKDSIDYKMVNGGIAYARFASNSYLNARVKEQGFNEDRGAPFYQKFYKANYSNGLPGSKGFPVNLKKITLINGYQGGNLYGSNGEQTFNARGFGYTCFIKCFAVHVMSFEAYNLGANETITKIARFKKTFNDKDIYAVNKDNRGNVDILPGSAFAAYDMVESSFTGISGIKKKWEIFIPPNPLFWVYRTAKSISNPNIEIRNNKHTASFMPSISTLGFKNPDKNWNINLDNRNEIINSIYFDDYYVPNDIQEHVQITSANVAWLNTWLDKVKDDTIPPAACPIIWSQLKLSGPRTICSQPVTYTIENIPNCANVTWTIHPDLNTINEDKKSITVQRLYPLETVMNGWIQAHIEDPNTLEATTLTKRNITIWKPGLNKTDTLIYGHLDEWGGDVRIPDELVYDHGARNIVWKASDYWEPIIQGDFYTRFSGREATGPVTISAELINSCGEATQIYRTFFKPEFPYYYIYSDSTTGKITITLNDKLKINDKSKKLPNNKDLEFDQIVILDAQRNIKYKKNLYKSTSYLIDANQIPNGIYTIQILSEGKVIEERPIRIKK